MENPVTGVTAEIELPGEVLVENTMLIVTYIDAEGKSCYAWESGGGAHSRAQVIGLLAMIQNHLIVTNADA